MNFYQVDTQTDRRTESDEYKSTMKNAQVGSTMDNNLQVSVVGRAGIYYLVYYVVAVPGYIDPSHLCVFSPVNLEASDLTENSSDQIYCSPSCPGACHSLSGRTTEDHCPGNVMHYTYYLEKIS